MNTSHLRRLDALLSDGADCGESAAECLEDAAALTCLLPEFHLMGISIGNEVTT